MKTMFLALAMLSLLAIPAVHADATAHVTFQLGAGTIKAGVPCALDVPAGANGAVVLDAAVAAGCIDSWSATNFGTDDQPNRFVTCINDTCGHDTGEIDPALMFLEGTYWSFGVDGASAFYGIDGYSAHDGTVAFSYEDYLAGFFVDTLP